MNAVSSLQALGSTSAAGAMRMPAHEHVVVGYLLAGFGASTAALAPHIRPLEYRAFADSTTAGESVAAVPSTGTAIAELRRRSGLTWQQLAGVFGVSPRALHFWASGKAMASRHEAHLHQVLDAVRQIDRGSARANRTLLLQVADDGSEPLSQLAAGRCQQVVALLGRSNVAARTSVARPDPQVNAARSPLPPYELAAALQDRIHESSGRTRVAMSVRTRHGR